MIRAPSPSPDLAFFPAGALPPTPPHADPLDDIYGSSPHASPLFTAQRDDEMLSDFPSRQRNLDTDAYREGLSAAKGQYVQEGFDEGFALGAEIGVLVGGTLGVLEGMSKSLRGSDKGKGKDVEGLWAQAREELRIENVLGTQWVDEEGIWKWAADGKEGEEVTFREVAQAHPVVKKWIGSVEDLARRWGVDLEAVEKGRGEGTEADAVQG
ncbi:hypothetical protein BU23DRAFT_530094 [Bimuria novae-zelandiae CBS 107.79]|uniref:Protein YAE1 n=1 Tax=Bimuria novae-zelandiae CBS 107.79 TaxID=1447943 RepID=A0A6A5VFR7_9PLEO|nr:hypothetical protein BU23DRAFT_530094 [Bimuria novae-zelandiae CBS 107.79]